MEYYTPDLLHDYLNGPQAYRENAFEALLRRAIHAGAIAAEAWIKVYSGEVDEATRAAVVAWASQN